MEAEILKLLPWASVMAMLAVVGVLVKVAMAYGKTTDTAAAAKATAEAVDRELDAFKLEVSRTYAQATTIRDMRDEITASMNRLGDRLDRIVEFANRQGQADRGGSHRS